MRVRTGYDNVCTGLAHKGGCYADGYLRLDGPVAFVYARHIILDVYVYIHIMYAGKRGEMNKRQRLQAGL